MPWKPVNYVFTFAELEFYNLDLTPARVSGLPWRDLCEPLAFLSALRGSSRIRVLIYFALISSLTVGVPGDVCAQADL